MVDAPADRSGAPERPDVDALMERVRAAVADKIARGVWTKDELERVERLELRVRQRIGSMSCSA